MNIKNIDLLCVFTVLSIVFTLDYGMASFSRSLGLNSGGPLLHPRMGPINLQSIAWRDQIKRRIWDIIKGSRQSTNSSIKFKPVKPPVTDKPYSGKHKPSKTRPVFSRLSDETNDTQCMKFDIPEAFIKKNVIFQGADIYVYFKLKKRRRKGRRIILKILPIEKGKRGKRSYARLQIRPTDTAWYKVSLPVSLMRKIEQKKQSSLQICIDCKKCNRRTKIIFPLNSLPKSKRRKPKSKQKKRKQRTLKTRRLRIKRPFMIYRTIPRIRSRRNVQNCENGSSQSCCRQEEFVSFADLGFENDILYPSGITYSTCLGSCANSRYNTILTNSNNSQTIDNTQNDACRVTKSRSTKVFVVFRERIGFLTLPNSDVRDCSCTSI